MKFGKKVGATTAVKSDWDMAAKVSFGVVLMCYAGAVLAGTADPLGSGICKFVDLLTGKWAFGISVVAMAGIAVSFMAGVEMSEMMKKLCGFFFAVAFLVFGGSILRYIYPSVVSC